MSIPFVRQLPNNRRVLQGVECSDHIEALGQEFIANGGRYLIEVLPKLGSPNVRVVACLLDDKGEQIDIVEETVENGPLLPLAISRVVEGSAQYLKEYEKTETTH